MTSATQLSNDYMEWVGRSETLVDVASVSSAVGLGALLDAPVDPKSVEGSALFPLGHWLNFTPTAAMSELGLDGHPKLGGFMPPLTLPRRMWAGSKIDYHSPIKVGQQLTRTTTIESITPKTGASGELCFVVLQHELEADGVHALSEQQTIVYREAVEVDASGPSLRRPPRPDGATPEGWDWARALRSNEVRMFRFSALTFNSHRIHYDLDYTTQVEGYPGLVVQGPLSAFYLVQSFLLEHPGAEITHFEFSARSPIFANEQVHAVGRAQGDGTHELAILDPTGKTAITASITHR